MDLKELKINTLQVSSRHPWEQARSEIIFYFIEKFFPEIISNDSVVLDIGCGDIYLIKELSLKLINTRFYAVDTAFDDELINSINNYESRISAYKTIEEVLKNVKKPPDLILLLDVVEHIEDDNSFIKNIIGYPQISNGTGVIVTVPAFNFLKTHNDEYLVYPVKS